MADISVRSVTKSAKRKVNLVGISSEYDNIEWGTFITADINYTDDKDFQEAVDKLSTMTRNAIERDIRNHIIVMKEMAKDKNNQIKLGLGNSLEYTEEEAANLMGDSSVADEPSVDAFPETEEKPKKKTTKKTPKKAVKKEEPKPEPKPEPEGMDDINDLLFGGSEPDTEEPKEAKKTPKKEPDPVKQDVSEPVEDGIGNLDFLDDSDKAEEKSEDLFEDQKKADEDSSEEFEEVDLDEFDFEEGAGDIFNE